MSSGSAETPNRCRWMRTGRECMAAGDWAGAIRAYAQGPDHTTVVVAAAELSHNSAGRVDGQPFPQWVRELWEPIRGAVQQGLLVHSNHVS